MATSITGIDVRHRNACPALRNADARCKCKPSYQAHVWSVRDQKRIRKTFATLAEAKAWRAEALVALREVWAPWLAGALDGRIRNRSGDRYKPSVLRGYDTSMRLRVLRELGGARLTEIGRLGVQDFADRLLAEGLARSATPSSPFARSTGARSPVERLL